MESVSLEAMEKRLRELEGIVAPYGSALVAFSGGVDSSLALAVAVKALERGETALVVRKGGIRDTRRGTQQFVHRMPQNVDVMSIRFRSAARLLSNGRQRGTGE